MYQNKYMHLKKNVHNLVDTMVFEKKIQIKYLF